MRVPLCSHVCAAAYSRLYRRTHVGATVNSRLCRRTHACAESIARRAASARLLQYCFTSHSSSTGTCGTRHSSTASHHNPAPQAPVAQDTRVLLHTTLQLHKHLWHTTLQYCFMSHSSSTSTCGTRHSSTTSCRTPAPQAPVAHDTPVLLHVSL